MIAENFGCRLVLSFVLIFYLVGVGKSENTCSMNSCPALQRAIELGHSEPSRQLKKGGEFEGGDYWEKHEQLFCSCLV